MKATMGMNYRLLTANLQDMNNKLFETRGQAASGKKLNRPSDDPSAIRPVLNYRVQSQSTGRYRNHLATAGGEMQIQDASLGNIENIMVQAKETAVAAVNSGANDADLHTYADRVSQLYDELLHTGNSRVDGKYVFSGYSEQTVPFVENPHYASDAAPLSVEFDEEEVPGENGEYRLDFSGIDFEAFDDLTVEMDGVTIAAAIETDEDDNVDIDASINGLIDAINERTAVGSGDPLAGRLERMAPVEDFDPESDRLALREAGPVFYQGHESVKTVELEPGRRVEKQAPGGDLFLGGDTGTDLFRTLRDLEHAIRTADAGEVNESLEDLEDGAEQVRRIRGRMGNNAWRIERAGAYLDEALIEFESIISGYEDADMIAVFSKLVQQETAFEAALSVTTRVSRLSILDFM